MLDVQTRAMRTAKAFVTFDEYGHQLDIKLLQKVLHRRSNVTILGAGCHGIVIDCGDYVLKFFHSNDTAYLAFINFCLAYGESPYLPKIYSFHRVNKFLYAVTLEKLKPFEGKQPTNLQEKYADIERLLGYYYFSNGVKHCKGYIPRRDYAFFQALRAYKAGLGDEAYNDLHTGNVMLRGEQIVITDPWC